MAIEQLLTTIRLFIEGVSDESSASAIDTYVRSLPGVVGSRVSTSGLCTIQLAPTEATGEAERVLIKQLTFDKYVTLHFTTDLHRLSPFDRYRAMAVSDAEGAHISRIRILLNGEHRFNRHYISDRFYQEIDGLVSCRFMDNDDSDDSRMELLYDSRSLTRFELFSAMQSLGYLVQLDPSEKDVGSEFSNVAIRIEGMHCNSCVSNICATVGDLPGAIDIKLTFEDKVATVVYDMGTLNLDQIINEIEKLGFKAAVANSSDQTGACHRARRTEFHKELSWL
jgi:copper chaperone CopZ